MITDYHVHLETGPYTIDWVKEYLLFAKEKGITDLGFSEHGYRFKQAKPILFNPWIEKRQTEDIDDYISLILEAKKIGLPVKLGIEMDYIPEKEKEIEHFLSQYPWDYVIGSIHWIDDWGFDLEEMKEGWSNKAIISIYKEYFNILEHLLGSNLFDILGHIDVIKVFGHKPDEIDNEALHIMYENIINKVKKSKLTVEISTAGFRKPVKEIYPAPELMKGLAENRIPLILSSDAHQPNHVGFNYEAAINYLNEYNIDKISIFNNRKREIVNLG